MGHAHHKSLLPPQNGFSYLPHDLALWRQAAMEKRGMQLSVLLRQLNLEQ